MLDTVLQDLTGISSSPQKKKRKITPHPQNAEVVSPEPSAPVGGWSPPRSAAAGRGGGCASRGAGGCGEAKGGKG